MQKNAEFEIVDISILIFKLFLCKLTMEELRKMMTQT